MPKLCDCCIYIDGEIKIIGSLKGSKVIELPYGKHIINVGINYDEMPESKRVHGANTWAWEDMKELTISEKDVYIEIKRKWHMTKHVSAEATIEYR